MRNVVEQTSNYWIKMCHIFHGIFQARFIEFLKSAKTFNDPRTVKYWNNPENYAVRNKINFIIKSGGSELYNTKSRFSWCKSSFFLLLSYLFFIWNLASRFHYAGDIKNICCLFALKFWQQTIQFKFSFARLSVESGAGTVGGNHSINSFILCLLWMNCGWFSLKR